MLKVKDEIDLKELEKFGFEFTNNGFERFCGDGNFIRIVDFGVFSRVLFIYKNWIMGKTFDNLEDETIIADLIQAGLVEKVEK